MNDEELLALNRAMEQINCEFCERFDVFNVRYPQFYNKFDSLESFELTLDYLPGTGALVRFLGLTIFRTVDDMPSYDRSGEFDLAGWFYEHLTEQISYAAQYASMLTKDGHTVCETIQERRRQDLKWGRQDHPNTRLEFLSTDFKNLGLERVRGIYKSVNDRDRVSWMDILIEEVAEAAEDAHNGNEEALYDELVQVAAVALQWAEKVKPK
jgi:hypothetical protein